jgi:hypothetical protein
MGSIVCVKALATAASKNALLVKVILITFSS